MHQTLIDHTPPPVRKRRGTVEECDAMETFDRFSGLFEKNFLRRLETLLTIHKYPAMGISTNNLS